MKRNVAVSLFVIFAALVLLFPADEARSQYNPCFAPATVGFGTRPNVMIVMDFSGSMQSDAYTGGNSFSYYVGTGQTFVSHVHTPTNNLNTEYRPQFSYFGNFDSDIYYIYDDSTETNPFFYPSPNPPVLWQNLYGNNASTENADGSVTFTTQNAHGFAVGDIVAFKGLTAHTDMNVKDGGGGYRVDAVSGNTFTVKQTWIDDAWGDLTLVGLPDRGLDPADPTTVYGQVVKRVLGQASAVDNANGFSKCTGTSCPGLSGNVLNFIAVTRIDAAMTALIGGKANCGPTDTYCYLRFIGALRANRANSSLQAMSYVRPGDVKGEAGATQTDPDNSQYGRFVDKDMFLSIWGYKTGEIRWTGDTATDSPLSVKWGDRKAEYWTFTVPANVGNSSRSIRIVITATGFTPSARLYNGSTPSGGYSWSDGGSNPLTVSATLAPGTYCLEVTSYPAIAGPGAAGSYTYQLSPVQGYLAALPWPSASSAHYGADASEMGSLQTAALRVRVPLADRVGVIQKSYKDVRYGFMYYRGDGNNGYIPGDDGNGYQGRILVGCDIRSSQDEDEQHKLWNLINAIQGGVSSYPQIQTDWLDSALKFYQVFPYNGTPTGAGMEQAYQYFYHNNASSGGMASRNSAFNPQDRDPYYDSGTRVPCRKSFSLLISDGEYTSGYDPLPAISKARRGTGGTGDIRSDLVGQQFVKTFSVYAFNTGSSAVGGQNAMKWGGMYGGFDQVTACGTPDYWPWPRTSLQSSPSATTFAVPGCTDKTPPDLPDPCCREWDSKGDGIPDAYYEASNGALLVKSLLKALAAMSSATSSAGAPAAVSQTSGSGDLLIRGVFEALDADQVTFLWRGHLEVFYPIPLKDTSTPLSLETVEGLKAKVEAAASLLATDAEKDALRAKYACLYSSGSVSGDPVCYTTDFLAYEVESGTGCPKPPSLCNGMVSALAAVSQLQFHPIEKHCWDAAEKLQNAYGARNIFTAYDRNSDGKIAGRGNPGEGANIVYPASSSGTTNMKLLGDTTGDLIPFYADASTSAVSDPIVQILYPLFNFDSTDPNTDTIPEKQAEAVKLIRWVRGEEISGYRDRGNWVLGDIVYSSPVAVGIPSIGAVSPRDPDVVGFYEYRNKVAGSFDASGNRTGTPRNQMVYVGANDGMVHAFILGVWDSTEQRYINNPDDPVTNSHPELGRELWAYVPSTILSELKALKDTKYGAGGCTHRAMVDLSPRAWDVYIHGDVPNDGYGHWRTVILGGLRGGGDVYFALDVTVPDKPRLLWEYSVLKDRVVVTGSGSTWSYSMPFVTDYDKIKTLPMSWNPPSVGRLALGASSSKPVFWVGDPPAIGPPASFVFAQGVGDANYRRHVMFAGGTVRVFDPNEVDASVSETVKTYLFEPHLLAVEIGTGENLFKYLWPGIVANLRCTQYPDSLYPNCLFPPKWVTAGGTTRLIPYALGDLVALDIYSEIDGENRGDGFVDHVFFGDLNGYFYRVRFRAPDTGAPSMDLSLWQTKVIDKSFTQPSVTNKANPIKVSNLYRSNRQPIFDMPGSTWDQDLKHIREIIGTGKYDNVLNSALDDKTDIEPMSLYNVRMLADPTLPPTYNQTLLTIGNFSLNFAATVYRVKDQYGYCNDTRDDCTWLSDIATSKRDCCNPSTTNCPEPDDTESTCWSCVYEFGHGTAKVTGIKDADGKCDMTTKVEVSLQGERVVGKPLVASGLVFVSTYLPQLRKVTGSTLEDVDPCVSEGQGFLYAFDYGCRTFPAGFKVFSDSLSVALGGSDSAATSGQERQGDRLSLGSGVPSPPVLDSSGTQVVVQSGGKLTRIGVKAPPDETKGWKIR